MAAAIAFFAGSARPFAAKEDARKNFMQKQYITVDNSYNLLYTVSRNKTREVCHEHYHQHELHDANL